MIFLRLVALCVHIALMLKMTRLEAELWPIISGILCWQKTFLISVKRIAFGFNLINKLEAFIGALYKEENGYFKA